MNRLRLLVVAVCGFVVVVVAVAVTSPVDPMGWEPPPPPPLQGSTAPNELLEGAEAVMVGVDGPEDVDVDAHGFVYGGTQDGRIMRCRPGEPPQVFAVTGGRPLGLHFAPSGDLLVCDAWKGLLAVDPSGHLRVLCTEADGVPFAFTDDVDVARDGTVFFTDASSRFHQPDFMLDAFELRPRGRLLRYAPSTGKVEVLLSGLTFANGVALSKDEDFVVVAETWKYRITRYWLRGPRRGTHDVFIDDLPGFPDGVAADRDGTFWVAMPTLRNPAFDAMHPHPWVKRVVARLPEWAAPKPARYGLVLAVDEAGHIRGSLHDVDGTKVHYVTSVQPHGEWLYLGSLKDGAAHRVARTVAPWSGDDGTKGTHHDG